jgi:hypothetical protein
MGKLPSVSAQKSCLLCSIPQGAKALELKLKIKDATEKNYNLSEDLLLIIRYPKTPLLAKL